MFYRLPSGSQVMGVHQNNSSPLTCSLEIVTHEQQLRNGRAKEHYVLTQGSPTVVILNKSVVRMKPPE